MEHKETISLKSLKNSNGRESKPIKNKVGDFWCIATASNGMKGEGKTCQKAMNSLMRKLKEISVK